MILDAQLLFSDTQAVTATALSTNVLDTGPLSFSNTFRDLGVGHRLFFVSVVTTTCTSGGSGTLSLTLETSAAAAITSANVLWTSPTIAVASLVAGYVVAKIPLPPASSALPWLRYLGARYTIGTADFTAGKFTTGLTLDIQAFTAYKNALTIS